MDNIIGAGLPLGQATESPAPHRHAAAWAAPVPGMTVHPCSEGEERAGGHPPTHGQWSPDMANSQLFHVCAQFCKNLERRPSFLFCCCCCCC